MEIFKAILKVLIKYSKSFFDKEFIYVLIFLLIGGM